MRFFSLFLPKEITPRHIEDFFHYSEVSRLSGGNDNGKAFGSDMMIITSRVGRKTTYEGIYFGGGEKSGYISIENGKVQYRYSEQTLISVVTGSMPTTDKKIISSLTKIFFKWYDKYKLPHSIQTVREAKKDTVSVLREIVIDGFDDEFPPVLRVLNNKTTLLVLGVFPPRSSKITKQQADNFDKLLANATGKKVIHDDREIYVIFDDSQKTVDNVISFLQNL